MLTLAEWVDERLENTKRIGRTKIGSERRGWEEDEAYWRRLKAALYALKIISEDADDCVSPGMKAVALAALHPQQSKSSPSKPN